MKKYLLSLGLLSIGSVLPAQDQFIPVWERFVGGTGANSVPAFFTTDNLTRGGSYNLASTAAGGESVILVSRNTANAARVLAPNTDVALYNLDNTGITGGTFPINLGVVDSFGAVYVCNLGTTTGAYKLYRYPSDAAAVAPTVIADGVNTTAARVGDAIDIIESGNNITIYATGNNAAARTVATSSTDGGTTWTSAEVGATAAATGITGDTIGGSIFLKAGATNITEYNQAGTAGAVFSPTSVPDYTIGQNANLQFFNYNSGDYIFSHSYRFSADATLGNTFTRHQVLQLTNRTAGSEAGIVAFEVPIPVFSGALANGNDNGNGSGAVQVWEDGGDLFAFVLVTNNYYGVYTLPNPLSVSDWDLF